MNKIIHFFKSYRLAMLSGILIGTSYIPFPPWALFFCFAPLWISLLEEHSQNVKSGFWAGWWTQFLLTLIGFNWILITAHDFGFMPWSAATAVLLLFCALAHLYIAIHSALIVRLFKNSKSGLLTKLLFIALSYALVESQWPSIFPWHHGYTFLWIKSPVAQTADIWGFQGLSIGIYLSNAVVAWAYLEWRREKSRLPALVVGLSLVAVWGFIHVIGLKRAQTWNQTENSIRLAPIQANIGNIERYYAEKGRGYQGEIINKYIALSQDALREHSKVDMLIWPEAAVPDYLDSHYHNSKNPVLVSQFLGTFHVPLITGGYSKDPVDPQNPKKQRLSYNALFYLNEKGEQLAVYRKTYLLAFGEYLPFGEWIPKLYDLLPMVSQFGRGNGPMVFSSQTVNQGEVKWGSQICYESLDANFTAQLAKKGADILVNLTNDSWFGGGFEPYQHMTMTLARAIETRRPLIRVTNTGISTAILANGSILQKSPIYKEWFDLFEVPFKKDAELTAFVKISPYINWLLLVIVGLGVIYEWSTSRIRKP